MFRRNAGGVPAGCAASDRLALGVIGVVSAGVVVAVAVLLLGGQARGGADVAALPALNALLNGLSAALLTAGYVFIRRRRVAAHLACMVGAFGVSTLFLISYVVYHYHAGSRPFTGPAAVRPLYLLLLLTHIVLAAVILPLALTTIYRALSAQFVRHVAIARWTLPLWLYVSITGVIIYWMLYHL
jgi:putative membrane protein